MEQEDSVSTIRNVAAKATLRRMRLVFSDTVGYSTLNEIRISLRWGATRALLLFIPLLISIVLGIALEIIGIKERLSASLYSAKNKYMLLGSSTEQGF